MIEFEWNADKGAANAIKHGVSFADATNVFNDVFAVHVIDQSMDYGEERFIAIGLVSGIVLTVVYVERHDRIRIISARKATRHEQRVYGTERGIW
jgi:uncharacterized DUF497 family protein